MIEIRYRRLGEETWKEGTELSLKTLIDPRDMWEIKLRCSHDDTFVDCGVRICKRCGDALEVTSFRD